jgi:imidazolonepropionase-like amidohydrolase
MVGLLLALAPAIAFVNVNLIRMDRERVEPGQTVIVRDDRIVVIGASADVPVPPDATVIHGAGRYLVPGLTDAHVHITTDMPWAPARPDFGDAPLYLAYGVTTVINLGGAPAQLEWRRRVSAGELPGPTIYTSGEFINEPRVNTPKEVADEVAAQHRAGYDLIKFHEIFTPGAGFTTTTGLSRAAYRTMNETARELGMPLVGHAPVNLGLDALLEARQPLAHMGMLSNIYFLPLSGNRAWLVSTAVALAVLTLAIVVSGLAARSRVRVIAILVWVGDVLAVLCAALFLPGGPLFASVALRIAFTALTFVAAVATVRLVMSSAAIWRERIASRGTRIHAAVASIAGLVFACTALAFWLPVAWRSSDWGIERLAKRIQNAGIPVQTTLVVYEALGGPGKLRLINDPATQYLRADTQALWRAGAQATGAPAGYADFMKKVAGALHRAGVPLIAGTDAMGLPLVVPGSSLHYELELLTESGLTPYESIRAATVAPAVFLRKDREFGSIGVGKRADLLLLERNPLQGVAHLQQPIGVMVRGKWLPREQLQQMLAALKNYRPT